MKLHNKNSIGLYLMLFAMGCGGAGQNTSPQVVEKEDEEDSYLLCELNQDVSACVVSLDSAIKSRLMKTLKAYGSNGRWSDYLFETKSFQRRYPITTDEKKCIKDMICN